MAKSGKSGKSGKKKTASAAKPSLATRILLPPQKWIAPALLVCVVALLFMTRGAWLGLAGRFLVVDSGELEPAELIAVFGGESLERPRYAALLYRNGLAPRVFVSGRNVPPALEAMDTYLTEAEVMARVLGKAGVPQERIVVVPAGADTWGEMEQLKLFVEQNGVKSVILVSSPPHMRRVHWCRKGVFRGSDVRFQYAPVTQSRYRTLGWWKSDATSAAVAAEFVLLLRHLAVY